LGFLYRGHLVHHLYAIHLSILNVFNSARRQGVTLVLIEFHDLINLVLGQKLQALSIWANDEHSWVDEASCEGISVNSYIFNVTLWFKRLKDVCWLPVIAFLILFIVVLFQLIQMIDPVDKWSLAISALNMHIFSVV